jgi:D-amino peptidase
MAVLLITDLEGVAGVDTVDALIEGLPNFPRARERLTNEVEAALTGFAEGHLQARDFVIGDTHMGGPLPNLLLERLPAAATLRTFRSANPADPAFFANFADVTAIACLGMHGGQAGFVPHCIDLSASFESAEGPLSETQLFLGVAAELGIPAVFVAGDDSLGDVGPVPRIVTKQALSPTRAQSRPAEDVLREIRLAAAAAPVAAPALPDALRLRFRSRWMADRAEAEGAARHDETSVVLVGDSLRARIADGHRLLTVASPVTEAFRPWQLVEDVSALAARSFIRTPPASRRHEAQLALGAMLKGTDGTDDWSRANRALTLHMLEGHAPEFFRTASLAPVLADAVERLRAVSLAFPLDLSPEEAMARLDAAYVLQERGAAIDFDREAFTSYCRATFARAPLYAWLLAEIGAAMGIGDRMAFDIRAYRRSNRVVYLYWLTHVFLLATRYLRVPLPRDTPAPGPTEIEELLLAASFCVEAGHHDLAAELAFCLVAAGEANAPERARILDALAESQRSDGIVPNLDTPAGMDREGQRRADVHCTLASLLAFATA